MEHSEIYSTVNAELKYSAKFSCQYCDKKFEWKKSLLKHHRNKHSDLCIASIEKFTCVHCNSVFTEKTYLKDHLDKFHGKQVSNPHVHMLIPCALCTYSSNSSDKLHSHYHSDHGIDIVKESVKFSNREEFLLWKEAEQKRTYSRYIQHTGVRNNQNGGQSLTYYCHRIGAYSLKRIRHRREREQGTKKSGRYCPSKIHVRISSDGKVNVVYVSTHVGHKNELFHIHLTAIEKMNIAQKLAMNIPADDILSEIRSAVDFNSLKRLDLLTKKDMYNIRNYCKETSAFLEEAEEHMIDSSEQAITVLPAPIEVEDNASNDSLDAIDINPEGFQDLAQRCIDELVQSIQENISMPGDLDIGDNITANLEGGEKIEDTFKIDNIDSLFSSGQQNILSLESLPNDNIEMVCTISLDSEFLNIRCDILQNL